MERWDLSSFYSGFDSVEFEDDFNKLKVLAEKSVKDFGVTPSDDVKFLEDALKTQEELNKLASKVFGFISLSSSANTQDEDARRAMVKTQVLSPAFALLDNKFKNYVKEIQNLDEVINKSEYLKQYEFIIKETKDEVAHTMSEELEVLTSELVQNSSSLWSQMQRHLTSTTEVEFDGKMISLTEVRNLAYSNDPDIRKRAYYAELDLYKKIEDAMSFSISGIKGEVNTLTKYRKFSSALDDTLFKSRMKKETLDALLSAMKSYLPKFRGYLKHKSKLLGHKNGLPWYDMFAPMGSSETKYTIKDAQEFILKQFGTFGEDLRNLAKRAFDNNWIDYLPRKAKVGGAFCSNNIALKESRILSNFGGEIGDVITLAHELGHAYHGDQIFKEAPLNTSYTMPVAETASTLCETITKKAAYKEAKTDNERIHILEQELQDSTQVIVDIFSRFVFEQSVFDARKKSIPSAKDLNTLMTDAQIEAYGDGLDHNLLNSGQWINKSHYYRGSLSFYNFPYAFGLLFAKGIYAKFLEEGESFVTKVNELLMATGRMSVEDVASLVGIDLTNPEFWKSGLQTISNDIDEFINLTSK